MPIVEITDKAGKKYRVEFERPPTDADIDSAVRALNSGRGAFTGSKATATGNRKGSAPAPSSDPFTKALNANRPKPKRDAIADPNPLSTAAKRKLAEGDQAVRANRERVAARDRALYEEGVKARGGYLKDGAAYFGPDPEDGTDLVSPDMLYGPRSTRQSGLSKVAQGAAKGIGGTFGAFGQLADVGGAVRSAIKAAKLTPEQESQVWQHYGMMAANAVSGGASIGSLGFANTAAQQAIQKVVRGLDRTGIDLAAAQAGSTFVDPSATGDQRMASLAGLGTMLGFVHGPAAIGKMARKAKDMGPLHNPGWAGLGEDIVGPHPIVPGKFDTPEPVRPVPSDIFKRPKPGPKRANVPVDSPAFVGPQEMVGPNPPGIFQRPESALREALPPELRPLHDAVEARVKETLPPRDAVAARVAELEAKLNAPKAEAPKAKGLPPNPRNQTQRPSTSATAPRWAQDRAKGQKPVAESTGNEKHYIFIERNGKRVPIAGPFVDAAEASRAMQDVKDWAIAKDQDARFDRFWQAKTGDAAAQSAYENRIAKQGWSGRVPSKAELDARESAINASKPETPDLEGREEPHNWAAPKTESVPTESLRRGDKIVLPDGRLTTVRQVLDNDIVLHDSGSFSGRAKHDRVVQSDLAPATPKATAPKDAPKPAAQALPRKAEIALLKPDDPRVDPFGDHPEFLAHAAKELGVPEEQVPARLKEIQDVVKKHHERAIEADEWAASEIHDVPPRKSRIVAYAWSRGKKGYSLTKSKPIRFVDISDLPRPIQETLLDRARNVDDVSVTPAESFHLAVYSPTAKKVLGDIQYRSSPVHSVQLREFVDRGSRGIESAAEMHDRHLSVPVSVYNEYRSELKGKKWLAEGGWLQGAANELDLDPKEFRQAFQKSQREAKAARRAASAADLAKAWEDVKNHNPKPGTGLGGFDAEYIRKVGVLVEKAVIHGYRTVEDFIARAAELAGRKLTQAEEKLFRDQWDAYHAAKAKPTPSEIFAKPKQPALKVETGGAAPAKPVKPGDATSMARVLDDAEREALGLPPTHKTPLSVAELADMGEKRANRADFTTTVQKRVAEGKPLNPQEVTAALYRKREILNEYNDLAQKIEAAKPEDRGEIVQKMRDIEAELQMYSEAGQLTRTKWHELGMALQTQLTPDYSVSTVRGRALEANAGQPLTNAQNATVTKLTARVSELEKQLAEARAKVSLPKAATNAEKTRSSALNTLRKIGVISGEAKPSGGLPSKQTGAILFPRADQDKVAKAIRSLARSYIAEGATSLDEVLGRLRADVPGLDDQQSLMFLSDQYRALLLESDVAKLEIDANMRKLRAEADRRTWGTSQKIGNTAWEIMNGLQRSFQAGQDLSAPFMQGRKVLTNMNTSGWLKAWGPMLKALAKGEHQSALYDAAIKRDPMYARARKAGLELTEMSGAYSHRDEHFATRLTDWMEKIPGVGLYAKGLKHSEAAYNTFLNKIRFDTFKKLAAAGADDAEYLRDVARMVNIATGRGDGKVAKLLGSPAAGAVMYAPRFAWSNIQDLATFGGTIGSKTTKGKVVAAKMAARGVVVNAVGIGLASLFMDVQTDPRSTDFGRVTLPDGTQIDLLGKVSDPIKLAVQTMYGKVSRTGNYTEPGGFSDSMPFSWIEGKLSPGARLLLGPLREGTYYDSRKNERVPVTPGMVVKEQLTPLAWRDVYEGNAPGSSTERRLLSLLSLLGMPVGQKAGPPKSKVKPPPPMSPLTPGIQKILSPAK